MKYEVVKSSVRHVKPIVARMRTGSCIAMQRFGFDPRRAVRHAFMGSFYSRTALVNGRPVAMWGAYGALLSDFAEPWLALTMDVMSMPIAIVREARKELAVMMRDRPQLITAMIPDDDAAIRFALYLGFSDKDGGPRKEMERRIKSDPESRISYGDSYVIPLLYNAGSS